MLAAVVDEQALARVDLDVRQSAAISPSISMRSSTVNRLFLLLLISTATIDLVEQRRRAADDVEVSVGDGIEGAGADGACS